MSDRMAEVLAAHQWYDATTDNEDPAIGCTGCSDWFGSEDALDDGTFAAHQSEMLTAAGFGNMREAKAQALEEAADWTLGQAKKSAEEQREIDLAGGIEPIGTSTANEASWWQMGNWAAAQLSARAAAVRGEG